MKKKIVITGTNGFIGKNLKIYFSQEKFHKKYQLICPKREELDLLETAKVCNFLEKYKPEIVVHSAVHGTLGRDEVVKAAEMESNLRMFFNLERCNKLYGKMYYFGSGAEYSKECDIALIKEEDFGKLIPKDQYGFSKYIMAKQANESDNIYDLRLFGVYGQYENYNYRFISNAICKALSDKDIVIRQNVYFDYLYIKDLCKIMEWFLENTPSHRQYNICTGMKSNLLSISELIKEKTTRNIRIQVENEQLGREYTGDNRRLLEEVGNIEFFSIEKAVEELIEYYREAPFKLEGNY